MSDVLAIALGVLFLVFWVCVMIYGDSLSKAYALGKEDYQHRKNRIVTYKGLARVAYKRGRRCAACTGNVKLKNRLRVRLTV